MFACTVASVGDAGALAAPPRDAAREWTMAPILIGRWGDGCLLAPRQVLETLLVSGQWPLFLLGIGAMFACTAASVGDSAREWTNGLYSHWALGRCLLAPRQVLETLLDASTCLLRSEPTTYLEDFVMTDYTLYEMLGDSIMPRRTLFPYKESVPSEETAGEKTPEEEFTYPPVRPVVKRPKARLLPVTRSSRPPLHRDAAFEATSLTLRKPRRITIKLKNCRSKEIQKPSSEPNPSVSRRNDVIVASGLLNRFRYRLSKPSDTFPIFGALTL
ncbi:unnamed protein product, partial [Iphiclides podalirius]